MKIQAKFYLSDRIDFYIDVKARICRSAKDHTLILSILDDLGPIHV